MGVLFWLWCVFLPDRYDLYISNCAFISFMGIKIIIGVNLLSYATRRRAGMEEREAADAVNDFGRDPIGEGKEEQVFFDLLCAHGKRELIDISCL